MENNELSHHGVRGQRWGVRRFQNHDGSLTAAGRKRLGIKDKQTSKEKSKAAAKEDRKKAAIQKAEAKAAKKAEKEKIKKAEEEAARKAEAAQKKAEEEAAKKAYDEGKQQALKTGSAQDVLKYKGDLTQQEMITAMNRIRWEQDMKGLSEKEMAAGKSKADAVFDKVGKYTDYAITASKAYNTFANVYNAFIDTDKPMLPTIQTDNTKSNRAQRRQEEKFTKKKDDDNGGDDNGGGGGKKGPHIKINNPFRKRNNDGEKAPENDPYIFVHPTGWDRPVNRLTEGKDGPQSQPNDGWKLNKKSYTFKEARGFTKEPKGTAKTQRMLGERKAAGLLQSSPTEKQLRLGERKVAGLLENPRIAGLLESPRDEDK